MITRSVKKKIGDLWFHHTLLPFDTARKLQGIIMNSVSRFSTDLNPDDSVYFAALGGLLSEAELDKLLDTFCETSQVSNTETLTGNEGEGVLRHSLKSREGKDAAFVGRYDAVYDFVGFCIEANFGALVKKAQILVKEAQTKAEERASREGSKPT